MFSENLQSIKRKNTEENIRFSHGTIIASSDGHSKSWEVHLSGVEEYSLLVGLLNSNNNIDLEFTCQNGKIVYGEVIITNVIMDEFIFKGTGPLRYKGNDNFVI
jgi:hypothetical protein